MTALINAVKSTATGYTPVGQKKSVSQQVKDKITEVARRVVYPADKRTPLLVNGGKTYNTFKVN